MVVKDSIHFAMDIFRRIFINFQDICCFCKQMWMVASVVFNNLRDLQLATVKDFCCQKQGFQGNSSYEDWQSFWLALLLFWDSNNLNCWSASMKNTNKNFIMGNTFISLKTFLLVFIDCNQKFPKNFFSQVSLSGNFIRRELHAQ